VVLFGKDFYKSLMDYMQEMIVAGTINSADLNLILVTDDVEEGIQHINKHLINKHHKRMHKPMWWLFESK
jgi:predicted Rossmann-fold nucleotide-binding protein